MRASNAKNMHTDKFLQPAAKQVRHIRKSPRRTFLLSIFSGLFLLLACSFGCAPSSPQGDGAQSQSAPSTSNGVPELTEDLIKEQINDADVWEVPEENGAAEPIHWSFDENEPKEIAVVEKRVEGESATIVLDIKTWSAPHARNQRYLAGQIRTEWKLKTGWVLRKWEIVETENISMKYRNLAKPPEQNSNR
jgi:hypothetical protein